MFNNYNECCAAHLTVTIFLTVQQAVSTLEGQFELEENNQVGDGGGEHVCQSAPVDLKQAAPRDG